MSSYIKRFVECIEPISTLACFYRSVVLYEGGGRLVGGSLLGIDRLAGPGAKVDIGH